MDNVCHTLVGAALARTGLRSRTALASATMMIGANFPDIDILSAPFGHAIEFRRGWTHGVLALVVLPFVLTLLVILWNRWRGKRPGVVAREILLLSAISIWTHPTLDWMNSYGLRWLMPFDGTWFYGDSLFIVDPWLLLVLGTGVWLARKKESARPARVAVAIAASYVAAMLLFQHRAEEIAGAALRSTTFAREKLVVTASPANPFRWRIHADDGTGYTMGRVWLASSSVALDRERLDKGYDHIAVAAAVRDPRAAPFLDWARLPFYRVRDKEGITVVRITDARYGASIDIPLNR